MSLQLFKANINTRREARRHPERRSICGCLNQQGSWRNLAREARPGPLGCGASEKVEKVGSVEDRRQTPILGRCFGSAAGPCQSPAAWRGLPELGLQQRVKKGIPHPVAFSDSLILYGKKNWRHLYDKDARKPERAAALFTVFILFFIIIKLL